MKPFKGPRSCGGWIGIAAAAAASAYSAYQQNKNQEQAKQDSQDLSAGGFERQAWLAQQQRKFKLQDEQHTADAVSVYSPFYKGPAVGKVAPISQTGLADWDPNATDKDGKPLPIPMLQTAGQANG
jgi:hypothetical protein